MSSEDSAAADRLLASYEAAGSAPSATAAPAKEVSEDDAIRAMTRMLGGGAFVQKPQPQGDVVSVRLFREARK